MPESLLRIHEKPATSFRRSTWTAFRVAGKRNWRHLRLHKQITSCCTKLPSQSSCAECAFRQEKTSQAIDFKRLELMSRCDKLDKQDNQSCDNHDKLDKHMP